MRRLREAVHFLFVPLDGADVGEPHAAHAARIRPLARVNLPVPLQAVRAVESLPTVGAHEVFRAAQVLKPVTCEVGGLAEALAAFRALVRLQVGMCLQVGVEVLPPTKALLALFAAERFFPRVGSLVPDKIRFVNGDVITTPAVEVSRRPRLVLVQATPAERHLRTEAVGALVVGGDHHFRKNVRPRPMRWR